MPLFKPSQKFQANTPDSSCCSTFNCRDLYYSPLRQEVFPKLSDLLRDLRDNPLTGPLEHVSRTWCFRSDNISTFFCWVKSLSVSDCRCTKKWLTAVEILKAVSWVKVKRRCIMGNMAPTWDCCTGRNDLLPGRNVGTEFAFQKCWTNKHETNKKNNFNPNMF